MVGKPGKISGFTGEYDLRTDQPFTHFMREAEAFYIAEKLANAGGVQARAASAAGMKYDTFNKKVRDLGLKIGRAQIVRDG